MLRKIHKKRVLLPETDLPKSECIKDVCIKWSTSCKSALLFISVGVSTKFSGPYVLTNFMPIFPFCTFWKHQKANSLLMFSGGIEKEPYCVWLFQHSFDKSGRISYSLPPYQKIRKLNWFTSVFVLGLAKRTKNTSWLIKVITNLW